MPEPLTRRQLRSFHLSGTVALPSPFPEVGRLALRPAGLEYGAGGDGTVEAVVIEHEQSHRVTISRTVRLADVAAVLFSRPLPPVLAGDGEWCFGPEVTAALEERAGLGDPALLEGIAYVRESAPVLMQVEVGMTAAASAEYYPPAVGERTDAHYDLDGARDLIGCRERCDRTERSVRRPLLSPSENSHH
jgi:hypothetical protein